MAPNTEQRSQVTPASASPLKELTPEERAKRFAELRERAQRSPLQVEGPPGWHPYWARKGDDHERSRLDLLGFRVVHEADPKNPRYKANGLREDGTYVLGDVILMEIQEEYWQFYEDELAEQSRAMVEGARDYFLGEAEKAGVPTFEFNKSKRAR